MVGRWLFVALLAGCGRIGFDESGDGGTGSGCIASLALGENTACVVRKDGELYCWGDDTNGQLADGRRTSTTSGSTTLSITPTGITAGERHTCAWNAAMAWCWGDNSYGQLGDGTTTLRTTPIVIPLAAPSVVAAGVATTCAIDGGVAKCWGKNHVGQIGDSTQVDRSDPTLVTGLGAVIAIATGANHSCAIEATNDVWCWGANSNGQLGSGDFAGSSIPVRVMMGPTPFRATQIAVGEQLTCAVDMNDKAWCWGKNNNGQLGNNLIGTDSNQPVAVMNLASNVVDIDAGDVHACAVLAGGGARCWGRNVSRLGNGDSMTSPIAAVVMNLPDAVEVAIGENSTCARRMGGGMRCWGQNEGGELAVDGFAARDTATDAVVTNISNVAMGGVHGCAVLAAGGVTCWGSNAFGQHGTGEAPTATTPIRVTSSVRQAALGNQHGCALLVDGTLACWGLNVGRLGVMDPSEALTPNPVPGLANIVEVRAGLEITCARDASGQVTCWGAGRGVGQNTMMRVFTPTPVMDLSPASQLSTGPVHGCALDAATHAVSCWGANAEGQIGDGTSNDGVVATPIVDLAAAESIALGNHNSCAIANREIWCWGDNSNGELAGAIGTQTSRRPISLGVVGDQVAAGDGYICSRDGTALTCWGDNAFGALGDPVYVDERAPGPVPGVAARTMASGGKYNCAITPDDDLWCWGRNAYGMLGDGTTRDRSTPMRVDVPCD